MQKRTRPALVERSTNELEALAESNMPNHTDSDARTAYVLSGVKYWGVSKHCPRKSEQDVFLYMSANCQKVG